MGQGLELAANGGARDFGQVARGVSGVVVVGIAGDYCVHDSVLDACAAGFDVAVAKHQFRANSRAQILGELDGLVKVIAKRNADGSAGQVLGVHMVGPWVTEQLSGGYLAVNWEATVAEVAEFIQPHPSLTELFGETVLSLTGRSLNA